MTKAAQGNWHKIVALLLMKYADQEQHIITSAELHQLGARDVAVAIKEETDGLHVFLVKTEEARRLAEQGLAEEGQSS